MPDRAVASASSSTLRLAARRENLERKTAATRPTGLELNRDALRLILAQLDPQKDKNALAACAAASRTLNGIAYERLYRSVEWDPASEHPTLHPIFRRLPSPNPFSFTRHVFIKPHDCGARKDWTPPLQPLQTVRLDNRRVRPVDYRRVRQDDWFGDKVHRHPWNDDWTQRPWECHILGGFDYEKLVVIHADPAEPFPVSQRLPARCNAVTSVIVPSHRPQPSGYPDVVPALQPQVTSYTLVFWPFRTERDRVLRERRISEEWRDTLFISLFWLVGKVPPGAELKLVGFERACSAGYIDKPDGQSEYSQHHETPLWSRLQELCTLARCAKLPSWQTAAVRLLEAQSHLETLSRDTSDLPQTPQVRIIGVELEKYLQSPESKGVLTQEELDQYLEPPANAEREIEAMAPSTPLAVD